jgi:DNA-binding transcriptional LysR family regulator
MHERLADLPRTGQWRYEVQHLSTLMGLVRAGLGVGIVPTLAMAGQDEGALLQRPLVAPDMRRSLVLVQRRGAELSPAAEILKSFTLDAFERFGGTG